jgi:hypothetical protein
LFTFISPPLDQHLELDLERHATLGVLTAAARHVNPQMSHFACQARALAVMEFLWERGWVIIPATQHVGTRLTLGILGLGTGGIVGFAAGFTVGLPI